MGTKFWEVVCDEHGIGSSGEFCGDNHAHLDRINVFYYKALGGNYVPRAVLFDLESGVIGAVNSKSPLGKLFSPGNLVNHTRGQKLGQRTLQKGLAPILLTPPL
jgi:tubulin beta